MARWSVLVIGVCAAFGASSAVAGLAGLDEKLNAVGRVGVIAAPTQIAPAATGAARQLRPDPGARDEATTARPEATADHTAEYRETDAPVAACRVEVARRRRLPPDKVAAASVTLRFTIDPNGQVRDAEALSAAGTDLEVAACAKRVLSDWKFPKPTSGSAVTIERAYRFEPAASAARPAR
jgi:outer membrane biosynthesis protein TonB